MLRPFPFWTTCPLAGFLAAEGLRPRGASSSENMETSPDMWVSAGASVETGRWWYEDKRRVDVRQEELPGGMCQLQSVEVSPGLP